MVNTRAELQGTYIIYVGCFFGGIEITKEIAQTSCQNELICLTFAAVCFGEKMQIGITLENCSDLFPKLTDRSSTAMFQISNSTERLISKIIFVEYLRDP